MNHAAATIKAMSQGAMPYLGVPERERFRAIFGFDVKELRPACRQGDPGARRPQHLEDAKLVGSALIFAKQQCASVYAGARRPRGSRWLASIVRRWCSKTAQFSIASGPEKATCSSTEDRFAFAAGSRGWSVLSRWIWPLESAGDT